MAEVSWKVQAVNKIKELLDRTGKKLICDICGGTTWKFEIGTSMPVSESTPDGVFRLGEKTMPVIAGTCPLCGNTRFFNLMVLGVVKAGTAPAQLQIEQQVNNIVANKFETGE